MGTKAKFNKVLNNHGAATIFKYRIRHISGFFKGLWLHSNACMNTVIVWYVSDVWLYSFSTLPYMCASAIINYNCAFGFASKLLLLHLAWCLTTKKKKKKCKRGKRNEVTLLHKSKLSITIRTHSLSFKGRSEHTDTEELALATNSGSSWTLHRLYWVSWGKLAFNTLANWENIIIQRNNSICKPF